MLVLSDKNTSLMHLHCIFPCTCTMYLLFDISLVAFTCTVVSMSMLKPGYRYHMLLNFLSNI